MMTELKSKKLKVGVLRGGPSGEYEVSLKTGKNILDALKSSDKYQVEDIFIDRSGVWHIGGLPRTIDRVLPHVDVVVNALHGTYGEDGQVQKILESHKVPFTGSGSLGSAIGMNKPQAKKFFRKHGLLTPEHITVEKHSFTPSLLRKIASKYPHLRLVKPASSGSSLGVSVANSEAELGHAINNAFAHSDSVLIEEFIKGREATCGVVEGTKNGEVYALHPVEIRDLSRERMEGTSSDEKGKKNSIWSYESKYSDDLHELICPGNFSKEESELIQQASVAAHKALGLSHYSRSDFILNRMGVYILETNTLPGLTSTSLFPRSLAVAGVSLSEFLDHIISLARNR